MRRDLPENNLRQYIEKKEKSNSGFWFIIVMLCATIIVMKWEGIKTFLKELSTEIISEIVDDDEKKIVVK